MLIRIWVYAGRDFFNEARTDWQKKIPLEIIETIDLKDRKVGHPFVHVFGSYEAGVQAVQHQGKSLTKLGFEPYSEPGSEAYEADLAALNEEWRRAITYRHNAVALWRRLKIPPGR